jgi:hypothetical protein
MKKGLLLVCALAPLAVPADPPASAPAAAPVPAHENCLMFDNRILGPRTKDRPLPLLSGDAEHGFHPACAANWSQLSPNNQALPVLACFNNSLLQVANDAACGRGTGHLWVSSRWVVTSAEMQHPQARAATCQQLETGAWAGTRDFQIDCVPQKKELKLKDEASASSAASASAPGSSPPPSTPR